MNASTVFHCKKKVALVIAFVSHRASDLVQFPFVKETYEQYIHKSKHKKIPG